MDDLVVVLGDYLTLLIASVITFHGVPPGLGARLRVLLTFGLMWG